MGYNRALDLMAIATAAVKAGLPEKAASYLQAAAKDPGADAAISAVFAANTKKKMAAKKKKAKASFTAEQLKLRAAFRAVAGEDADEDKEIHEGDEEVDMDDGEDTVSGVEESDEDMMKVEDAEEVAALRAALTEGTQDETIEDMTREEESEGAGEPTPAVNARKATAKVANERFSRTLRNLAARSK